MHTLRIKHPKNVIISYLNINSIRNKFKYFENLINKSADFIAIAESKLDESFPENQFLMNGYKKPYRLDVTDKSGGLIVFVNNDISSRRLKNFTFSFQVLPIEINLKKEKWVIFAIYRPPKLNINFFLDELTKGIDFYSKDFSNIIIMGDFNAQPSDISEFLAENDLFCHTKNKTCFKSPQGTCIDLILSNKKFCLQNTGSFDSGLSDHHHFIYTLLKTQYVKLPPKNISYRNFSNFNEQEFLNDLHKSFSGVTFFDHSFFSNILETIIEKHVPLKNKIIRANQKPYVNKELSKAIMKRTQLKNVSLKNPTIQNQNNYKKQRNYVCSLNRENSI